MITKKTVVDQITVTDSGIVLYREATQIIEDGVVLTQTYHRTSVTPTDDLTKHPDKVVAICNVAWTDEVVANYKAQQEAALNPTVA
jgi:hypothetical protein